MGGQRGRLPRKGDTQTQTQTQGGRQGGRVGWGSGAIGPANRAPAAVGPRGVGGWVVREPPPPPTPIQSIGTPCTRRTSTVPPTCSPHQTNYIPLKPTAVAGAPPSPHVSAGAYARGMGDQSDSERGLLPIPFPCRELQGVKVPGGAGGAALALPPPSPFGNGCIGTGGEVTPLPSRTPSLCPATVSLTTSAGFSGIYNRQ